MADPGGEPLTNRFAVLRSTWWPHVEACIDDVLETSFSAHSLLRAMAQYQIQSGGKHLRAVLPLLVADALGHDPALLVPFGAACETLHNASLVHDDLQDGDVVRRSQPTVWKKFGAEQAINLGDALIACTLLLMQRLQVDVSLRERATRRLLIEMLRVIEGQVEDLEMKDRASVTLADYIRMVEGKTSRLFALPMAGAALLCGADEDMEQNLVQAARHMGVLFQIQDDVVEFYGNGDPGRPGNSDGQRNIIVIHYLQSNGADIQWAQSRFGPGAPPAGPCDMEEARTRFRQSGSLDFALEELGKRRRDALSFADVAGFPALHRALGEACHLFLQPVRAALAESWFAVESAASVAKSEAERVSSR